jgi:O-Antigen ligase
LNSRISYMHAYRKGMRAPGQAPSDKIPTFGPLTPRLSDQSVATEPDCSVAPAGVLKQRTNAADELPMSVFVEVDQDLASTAQTSPTPDTRQDSPQDSQQNSPHASSQSEETPLIQPSRLIPTALTVVAILGMCYWFPISAKAVWGDWWFAPLVTFQDFFGGALCLAAFVELTKRILIRKSQAGRQPPATDLIVKIGLAFVASQAVLFCLHPSQRGLQTMVRLVAGIYVLAMILEGSVRLTVVAKALIGIATVEATIAGWGLVTGRALGVWFLGEPSTPFHGTAPTATFAHPYPLAALGLMAAAVAFVTHNKLSLAWSISATASCGFLVGASASRGGALTFALMCIACATLVIWGNHRARIALLLVVFVVTCGSIAYLRLDGWSERAATIKTTSTTTMANGRAESNGQSLVMIRKNPLGVGPGNYGNVLKVMARNNELTITHRLEVVHNVPLLILAEGGVVGFALFIAFSVVMLARLKRLALRGALLLGAILPYFMLDQLFWWMPGGIFLLTIWVAVISSLSNETPVTRPSKVISN